MMLSGIFFRPRRLVPLGKCVNQQEPSVSLCTLATTSQISHERCAAPQNKVGLSVNTQGGPCHVFYVDLLHCYDLKVETCTSREINLDVIVCHQPFAAWPGLFCRLGREQG